MSEGSFILDSATRGILGTNLLGGNIPYDNSAYEYDSTESSYEGIPNWPLELTASFEFTSSATASLTISATASASLGSLDAQATEQIDNPVSASADLGDLNAFAIPTLTRFISGEALLGELTADAESLINNPVSANANLGSLESSASSELIKSLTAQAELQGLQAQATLTASSSVTASAELGGLSASATTETPTPPTPDEPKYGSRGYTPIKKKQKQVVTYFEPEIPVIKETEPARPVFKTVTASADTLAGIFDATAQSQIDFSILEDEAELLLLI